MSRVESERQVSKCRWFVVCCVDPLEGAAVTEDDGDEDSTGERRRR